MLLQEALVVSWKSTRSGVAYEAPSALPSAPTSDDCVVVCGTYIQERKHNRLFKITKSSEPGSPRRERQEPTKTPFKAMNLSARGFTLQGFELGAILRTAAHSVECSLVRDRRHDLATAVVNPLNQTLLVISNALFCKYIPQNSQRSGKVNDERFRFLLSSLCHYHPSKVFDQSYVPVHFSGVLYHMSA